MADLATSFPPARERSASDALGLWEPKRTLTLEAARAHTARIAFLRRALLFAALLLVGVLVFYFVTQSPQTAWEDDPDTSVRMVNPRYSGRTADGLPYTLTSKEATRQLETRNLVELNDPLLEFVREAGAESSFVEAPSGTYDDVEKVLDLRVASGAPDVVLETDDGVRCETSQARIFARDKRIEGDQPITCTGEFGVVSGEAFEVNDNYTVFVFKGGMSGQIERGSANAAPAVSADDVPPPPQLGDAGLFGPGGEGPINIAARRAEYFNGRTDLSGDVVVVQDGATVYADDMIILRQERENAGAGTLSLGAVSEITGTGNFRYVSDDNDVRGERGVYIRDTGVVTVTGNVRVVQPGGNTVSTDRLRYDTRTETIRFSGQCQGRNCAETGRTGITIRRDPPG